MAARAAVEDIAEGNKDSTPFWRTLKEGGLLNPKYPGGAAEQAEHLKAEGHEIEFDRSGQPKRVKDWENKLVKM
jgi:hypothetical protein